MKINKALFLLSIVFIVTTLCGCSLNKYNYERDGFIGLEKTIKVETTITEIKDIALNDVLPTENNTYYIYEDVKLFDKYLGNFYVFSNSKDLDNISYLYFTFTQSNIEYDSIYTELSNSLGKPDHIENINDKTKNSHNTMWYIDDAHYINLNYLNSSDKIGLYLCTYDISFVEKSKAAKKAVESDDFLSKNTSEINSKANLIGSCLQALIDDNKVEFSEITTSRITFVEKSNLLGYSGFYEYEIENPNQDNFHSNFIGEIKDISFNFNNITNEDADKILSYLNIMFGENELDSESEIDAQWESTYSECIVRLKNTDNPKIAIGQNNDAYIYDVSVNYSESREAIPPYTDMSTEDLHIDDIDYDGVLNTTDDSFKECWKIAQEAVLEELKSPSTATFPKATYLTEDISIVRHNNEYIVYSWVDAQNSFGAIVRTEFLVGIKRSGSSFYSTGVVFDE